MAKKLAFDRVLFTSVAVLVGLGLAMVYSASAIVAGGRPEGPLLKQAVAAGIGLVGMLAAMHVDYRRLNRRWVIYSLVGGVLVLLVAALLSPELNNARRWLFIGSFSVQPSELAKLALVAYLAYQISKQEESGFSRAMLLPAGMVAALMAGLVFFGRDLGSAMLLGAVTALMLFLAGLPWLYLGAGLLTLAPMVAASILLVPYRRRRLLAFLDPEQDPLASGFQTLQSLIAVGSGGLFGLGLGESVQKLYFLPYPHSDFVFAIVGEELGMLGALGVLALFGIFLWRGLRAGHRAPDTFGRFLAWGLTGAVVVQALIHISVALALMPATGITLPFISYGGSSLVVTMTACGVILNVSQHG